MSVVRGGSKKVVIDTAFMKDRIAEGPENMKCHQLIRYCIMYPLPSEQEELHPAL